MYSISRKLKGKAFKFINIAMLKTEVLYTFAFKITLLGLYEDTYSLHCY